MEVTFINHYCPDKPDAPHAHYWVGIVQVDKGTMFICKHCQQFQWWPNSLQGAEILQAFINRFGADKGYQEFMEYYPVANRTLLRLNDLRHIRKVVTDEQQLAAIVLAINRDSSG